MQKKTERLRNPGLALIIVGSIIAILGFMSYSNRICNCPAQIVGQPVVPCCLDASIVDLIYGGSVLVIIGIIIISVSYYARSNNH